jgi:purine-binding chemotaxis protein CheW
MSDAQLDVERTAADVADEDAAITDSANQFVTFEVAGEMFAVPMGPVQEIIRVPDVARLPLAPPSLEGLANLRGRVLPIVNLRRLFNTGERERDDSTRAVVINLGQPLGFVVDRVASVVSVDPGQIEAADAIQSVVDSGYLTGVIKREDAEGRPQMLLTLDFEQLVEGQFSQIRKNAGALAGSGTGSAGAQGHTDEEVESDDLRLVSFTVEAQEYAIDIADVQEIVQVPERITALPNAPGHVVGLINLRQRLLPLVSLRTLFGLPPVALGEHHRIVVVALPGGAQVGLVTDSVKEVLSVPREQADAMPGLLAQDEQMQEFASICRIDDGKRLVSIIATGRLLGMSAIKEAVAVAVQADGDGTTEEAMRSEVDETDTDDDTQLVIFRLGSEEFGVPIMTVQEIVRVPDVLTRIPKTPAFVEGVINLRGSVLPVIDQRRRLGLEAIERNDGQRIMVYMLEGIRTGFIVDSVAEVLRIPHGSIESAPDLSEEQGRLITRIAKLDGDRRMVMLIDPQQLLGAREVGAMECMLGGEVNELPPLARAA